MFLAVILYCSVITDPTSCDVMIRKNHLFKTEAECQEQIKTVARGLLITGHYVKAKCFAFNPYGEEA
tara:strand:- start:369 stop:569 length:201 start_codon:yes stop_codon:yes gene_type:complete